MARTKSMATIENEIAEAKEVVLKTKAKHEAAIANLEAVMARKDELVAKDLLDAFQKSGKSYDAVMRFLKEGSRK
ncbi:MAG: hypothetical protein PHT39_09525 [Sphaerochaetaceae bacterium]|jgi:hypothetical protein|nr:hypothetical protein [Candidatus Cloacimonadota bacterium]MDD2233253.1 hypothetical protein [Sphaerochaetaceae bacterium]MDD4397799.1 hypothetical protein [Sphaerochaetaceae bacterium]NBK25002.1 hypothetical protein [Spirochaetia bacterium]